MNEEKDEREDDKEAERGTSAAGTGSEERAKARGQIQEARKQGRRRVESAGERTTTTWTRRQQG